MGTFAQLGGFVKNGDFSLPANGKKIDLATSSIPNWYTDGTVANKVNRESGYFASMCSHAKSLYTVVNKITAAKAVYNLSFSSIVSWDGTAKDTVTLEVRISAFSSDRKSRTLIDSLEFVTILTGNSSSWAPQSGTVSIPAASAYVGDSLVIEFDVPKTVKNPTDNNVWCEIDNVGLYNPPTSYNLAIVNPGFEFPNDKVKYLNINNIPGWHSEDVTSDHNGREMNSGLKGSYREYSVNTAKPIYQVIDLITEDSAKYNVSYMCGLTWNQTAKDTVYSVVYLSHYSSDITKRTIIDSVLNRIDTLTKPREMSATFSIPEGAAYVGDKLVLEFKSIVWNDAKNTNTWTCLDTIAVVKTGDSIAPPPPIPFNLLTFQGDVPAGGSLITVSGTNYLKIRLDGWNTSFPIVPVTLKKGETVEFGYKYDPDTTNTTKYAIKTTLGFVQFMVVGNTALNWAITDSPIDTGAIKTKTAKAPSAITYNQLQLAAQYQSGSWPAIAGGIVYLTQMQFYTPFNLQTFAGDVPAGGKLDTIGGTPYLKIRLAGWNTSTHIVPVTLTKGESVEFGYKYDPDTTNIKTYPTASTQAFIQFMIEGNTAANWAITDSPIDTGAVKTLTTKTTAANTYNMLQLAAQYKSGGWPAINGGILYLTQMQFYTPFDIQTFAGGVPTGGVIDTISGTPYLKIRLDGWNTAYHIVPVAITKGETVEFSYKYDPDTTNITKYPTATTQAFVQFMIEGKASLNWAITDSPIASSIKTITTKSTVAQTFNFFQLAAQFKSGGWPAIAGGILYISQVTLTPVDVKSISNSSVGIYPNPAGDFINLKNVESATANIEIYDIQGQLVILRNVRSNEAINISTLRSGMYLVKVYSGNNYSTFKMVKR